MQSKRHLEPRLKNKKQKTKSSIDDFFRTSLGNFGSKLSQENFLMQTVKLLH